MKKTIHLILLVSLVTLIGCATSETAQSNKTVWDNLVSADAWLREHLW